MYYDLPFCRPSAKLKHKPEGLGEVVEGASRRRGFEGPKGVRG